MVNTVPAADHRLAAPLGEFEVVVLLAVLQLQHASDGATETYGTTILQEIERRTKRPVSRGAVYVTLDRLEAKRLLLSRTGDAPPARGGRPRRWYRATPLGVRAAKHSMALLARMHAGLESLLGTLS